MQYIRLTLLASLLCARLAYADQDGESATVELHGDQRLLSDELSVGVGALGIGYTVTDGRWGDLFVAPSVDGRLLLGGFTLDGGALLAVPTSTGGAALGATLTARLGYTGRRFSILVGPSVQFAAGAPTTQFLPSARAQLSFGGWGLSAGLFDFHALAPFHLSVELGSYGIGYVAPLGAQAHARVDLGGVALRVQGLAFALANTQVGMLSVSGVIGGNGGAR